MLLFLLNISKLRNLRKLNQKVNEAHETLIAKVYRDMQTNDVKLREQDHTQAIEWSGRTPDDGEIFPNMLTEEAERLIRATTHPYPGAFIRTATGRKIIWESVVSTEKEARHPLVLKDGVLDILRYEERFDE